MTVKRYTLNFVTLVGLVLMGFVVALAILQAGLGRGPVGVQLADHECYGEDCYDPGRQDYDQWNNEDRNRNRNRNRGAFSPGPFDDSPVDAFNGNTVCLPGSTCYGDRRDDRQGR